MNVTPATSLGKNGDNMKKAKWIVVTGLDGSGKTHLVENLAQYYESKGLRVKTAHLPYDEHLRYDVLPKLRLEYSDRLLFALDNHIFACELQEWSTEYDIIITQRGFFDSFVHGAVQGFSYSFIGQTNRIEELPKADVMIHLVASARVAFERIKDDPDADKFEYPSYLRSQENETRRGYHELVNGNPDLLDFDGIKNHLIDTTKLSIAETYEEAVRFLEAIDQD